MKNKKNLLINILSILIIVQPFFDIFVYFLNNIIQISFSLISFVRPIIAIIIYFILLFSYDISNKQKKYSFSYLIIYGLYCIIHLINIRNNFFDLSYGNMGSEIRFLCNFGYFILQLINFNLLFKIIDENQKKKIIMSVVYAIMIMIGLYFVSVLTHTSPKTYIYSSSKLGWKGWSVSSHYLGHSILYSFPVIIYALFEKKYLGNIKYLIVIMTIIPAYYMVGTKTPLFAILGMTLFYTFIKIVNALKNKKIDKDSIYFIFLSLILIFTIKYTFGYDNFKNQLDIASGEGDTEINLIEDNLKDYDTDGIDSTKIKFPNFEDRMLYTIYVHKDIKSSVFDTRTIQKILNKYLRNISPVKDKILGYGHSVMPNCTWVETDFLTIFYCYGIVGFILIVLIPFGYVSYLGIKNLINIKKMNNCKYLLGSGLVISLFTLYYVGYTMQFAQTVFYLIVFLTISIEEFSKIKNDFGSNEKDYLFAINDLSIGGAEVGMVDVINELVNNGKKVDLVLLRKKGPLLEKINDKVNIYSVIDESDSKIKQKIYYVFYMLGGPFIKYVYGKIIKDKYKTEIAYLEGYPAVFIAASNNPNSTKVASIRVGLKSHKLKAEKLPWGSYNVKKAYKKMDNIYTVSNLTTEEFLEKYPCCKNKTHTIYTYFNIDDIRKRAEENFDYEFDKNKINFLAVGRFSEQKSYDRLIKAFSYICKENDDVLLHFVGKYDTECGKKIINLISKEKLDDKVILHGVINNPYPYIKNCDCLISSSLYEGFPRVINEAISLGKLCIGTNVTGTNEALHYGKLGLLVDDSIEGLIGGMKKFISNPNLSDDYKDEINKFDGNKETYFEGLKSISQKKENMIIYMPKLSFGGMEKALVNLINYCKLNEKYNLTLYLTYKGEMNYIDLLPNNINLIIACPGKWNIFGKLSAGIKLCFRYIYHIFNKYDIAISYSYQHPILNSLTRFSSKNNIVYIHGNLIDGSSEKEILKRVKKCKYEKFNKIICVSEDAKLALVKLINRDNNIFVVNNIIDGDSIITKSNEEIDDFKFDKNKIYFINVARHYEKYKRLARIIDATYKLNQEGYDFEVIFVGDGEDHQMYVDKIKKLEINNIHLLGKKKNPYKYLKNSSAFLLSSSREGYPVVFIESMILDKPIITTNISDAKIDIEGKYGIVVENNDDSIYEGMKIFLNDGYKIKEKFNYLDFNDDIIQKIDKIYSSSGD